MANPTNVFDFDLETLAQFLAKAVSDGTYADVANTLKTGQPGEEAKATDISVAAGQLWSNMVDDFILAAYPILAAGGGGSIAVEENGSAVVPGANTLNFSGGGATQVSITQLPAGQANIEISTPAPPPSAVEVYENNVPTVAAATVLNVKDTTRASWQVIEGPPGQANLAVIVAEPVISILEGNTPFTDANAINFAGTDSTSWVLSESPAGQVNVALNVAQEAPVFGEDYQSASEDSEITANTGAWVNVIQISFTPASAGEFRGSWSSEVDSGSTYIALRVRHRSGGAGPWDVVAFGEITAGTLHDPHGGILVGMDLQAELQEFEIDIQSGAPPTSVGARRTRMDLWKVRNL